MADAIPDLMLIFRASFSNLPYLRRHSNKSMQSVCRLAQCHLTLTLPKDRLRQFQQINMVRLSEVQLVATGLLTDRSIDRQIDLLVDWLVDWLFWLIQHRLATGTHVRAERNWKWVKALEKKLWSNLTLALWKLCLLEHQKERERGMSVCLMTEPFCFLFLSSERRNNAYVGERLFCHGACPGVGCHLLLSVHLHQLHSYKTSPF